MKPYIKIIKSQLRLQLPQNSPFSTHIIEDNQEMLLKSKRLHAAVYLKRNFISEDEIDEKGVIHDQSDPHQHHSDYFAITDKADQSKVLATARQIKTVNGHNDLPILNKARIGKKHREKIMKLPHDRIIEISGLAKDSGVQSSAVIDLYKIMWHYSIKKEHAYWLLACDVRLYRKLKVMFGGSIHKIGKQTHYKGGDIIPCIFNLEEAHKVLEKHKRSHHPIYGSVRRRVALYLTDDTK